MSAVTQHRLELIRSLSGLVTKPLGLVFLVAAWKLLGWCLVACQAKHKISCLAGPAIIFCLVAGPANQAKQQRLGEITKHTKHTKPWLLGRLIYMKVKEVQRFFFLKLFSRKFSLCFPNFH
jgi:hypothetical protein